MNRFLTAITAMALMLASCTPQNRIDLSGEWQVSLDSLSTFTSMSLPGTTDMAGLGTPNTLEPAITGDQIQRLTRRNSFIGEAFYKRQIEIPAAMAGKPLEIRFERVLWQSSVWIDGKQLDGAEESLTTAHYYRIPEGLEAGTHEMMVRVDNRKRYDISWRDLAHAYTNDTQIIWNGILGEMSIKALEPLHIAKLDVYPDVETRSAKVVASIVNNGSELNEATLKYKLDGRKVASVEFDSSADTSVVQFVIEMGEKAALWDEFSPVTHTVTVSCGDSHKDAVFGLRSFTAQGKNIVVNGRKTFLRGTLDCCIFPLTGNPPLDEAGWEKEFSVCKEWGLNHVRFHSWCPPDAAFRVADRMGIYLQVELPVWTKNLGGPGINEFLTDEYKRIIAEYGNHPSFCMLSGGNELDRDYEFLNDLLRYMKATDPRHIYTNSTYSMGVGHKGYPEPEDEFMVASRTYKGQIRGQDYINSRKPDFRQDFTPYRAEEFNLPLISHEIGQYSVYPRLAEIEKYTGTLDPLNFKGVRQILQERGRLDRAEDYTLASGRLAALLYKEEVERALRTPELAGFQMLGLQDFSGQSTALVGLVDAFWDNKGLVTEEWFRQACSPVTPLARIPKMCWTSDEVFETEVEIANYWAEDIKGEVEWSFGNADGRIAGGTFKAELPTGGNTKLSESIKVDLKDVQDAAEMQLTVAVKGTQWSNSWNVWVYPAGNQLDYGEVVLAKTEDEAVRALREGATVLLAPDPALLKGEPGKFVPVFWSPVFFPLEAGTMGVLCDPAHPALKEFPTRMHSDWQWWNLTKNSKALSLEGKPQVEAVVEAVDNFTMNRRLAYVFEANCESGRLLFCAMDVTGEVASENPEMRQMLSSLVNYMNSEDFHPEGKINTEELASFFYSEQELEMIRRFGGRRLPVSE